MDTKLVMAVQIAKNILGCKKVIGMAGTDEKCKWVESIGADLCLNCMENDDSSTSTARMDR
jgi:hypothetical protein